MLDRYSSLIGAVPILFTVNILYPNKVMANIHVSWLDPHKIRTMVVVGSKKMVVYDECGSEQDRFI